MLYSIKQEFYKLNHKKIAWIAPIILLALMILAGYSLSAEENKLLLALCFDAPDWIMFILVVVGATTFSMEFQNNAILTLLYKAANKVNVYLSKYIVLFIYDVFLHLLALIYTVFLHYTLFRTNVKWTATYLYGQPVWKNMLQATTIDLVTTMLVITLIFLLSCLINNNAIVVTVGFLLVFMGQAVSSDLLNSNRFINLMKWNPLNMMELTRQFCNYSMYVQTTHLNNSQILNGSLGYIAVFFILGYLVFRQKRF
ncbi:ABC transporter permease [Bombilactobacillus bombi]|uniref:ABC transporter permease n=1 Tax=Bombilactobacillus bombi TaxID=1303590 RepID=UPI0015E5D0CA|nr:ABC transporter permease [Bombilactobacillus bombi]MBA1434842.1 ABC transporter permease [Bombilactobacillus bombi]